MRCDNCQKEIPKGETACPNCERPPSTTKVEPALPLVGARKPQLAISDGSPESSARPNRPASPPPPPKSSASVPTSVTTTRIPGLRVVLGRIDAGPGPLIELVKDGYQLYVLGGLSGHGKTDMMVQLIAVACRRYGMNSDQIEKVTSEVNRNEVMRTDRGSYNGFTIELGRERLAVWDLAGENFQQVARTTELWELMAGVIPQCSGIMLNISLCTLWHAWNEHITLPRSKTSAADVEPSRETSAIARTDAQGVLSQSIDTYLWFLRYAFAAHSLSRRWRTPPDITARLNSEEGINSVLARRRRCPLPVFVNLSMADLYAELKTPETLGPDGSTLLPETVVDPVRHDPNAIGYLYLGGIYEMLRMRARSFRFGFTSAGAIHSDPRRLRVGDRVEEAFQFLSGLNWRTPGYSASSMFWVRQKQPSWERALSDILSER